MRIAILTESTHPCGGVAHALALAEALCALGHEAVIHAPDPTGRGLYRDARCPVVSVAVGPAAASTVAALRARAGEYLAHFSTPAACDFDVFHAHGDLGGNALATLTRRRLIPGFVRTVHRLDASADPDLAHWHERGIVDAGRLLAVSLSTARTLTEAYGAEADVVGHGVDRAAFRPDPQPDDADLARRLGLGGGPVFLAIGGFEPRENALGIITAFAAIHRDRPEAQLVVAGGASSLDRSGYEARCCAALETEGLEVGPGRAVMRTGPVAQADMQALYRLADAVLLPSLGEGHGLCVLEAMACGRPAIVSARPPFTACLAPDEALFVDPDDAGAIAAAMRASLEPARRAGLAAAGRAVARDHSWEACAARHLPAYEALARIPAAAPPAATGSGAWNTTRMPRDA